jgi:hypothetical protein
MNQQITEYDNGDPISFRCPKWMRQQLDRKVAETVIGNSTHQSLYRYTRTDLILESLMKSNGFNLQHKIDEDGNGIEQG